MTKKCDHVGAAFYTSTDGKTKICYRCGKDVEIDLQPRPEPSTNTPGKVGREHPETAKKAADRIQPATGTQRQRVLTALAEVTDGMTDEELQSVLTMNPSSQRPRRIELVEQGWVEDSGTRRKTTSGTEAIVWRYRELQ